ncbi:M23 family metallopeptidase [Methylobacterium brachythecii]|uniref:Membrane protein n=1 Tax=Methylobacterium brachythecii TaxID=1176177 RepID=A0A7W6ALX5_9HYPH|nr:M23 family metallopeptidase [Methylobacterium brachythecii]MBB3903061.1 murein DD-endopeptidase MepM/ murein hydrolase activator NlpD [Methylobacterium brachythecii]GLS45703.1 membrane protein [Methylobacterium brachythecii]
MRPISPSTSPADGAARRRDRLGQTPAPRRSRLAPALAVALCASTVWAGATTYYIVFRDETLGRFFAQVRTVELAYQERLGALQSQVDQTVSERIRSREGFESRLGALAERQALMERRQGILAALGAPEPETTGSILTVPTEPTPAAQLPQKPFPTPEPSDAGGSFDLRMRGGDRVEAPERRLGLRLARLNGRLDQLAERQSEVLGDLTATTTRTIGRLRSVIARAGLDPSRFDKPERGVGGPLVPLTGDAFDRALAEAQRSGDEEQRLRRTVATLPLRKPLAQDAVYTSTFGARLDPFTRGLALHTGIDMRAEHGAPARATAAGRVTVAEPNGGYGNMVEVDHGHGLVTRYAHLASFSVTPGQRVEAGAVIGRVGSTGRSTGNHLHYEVRIDGEPVDPQRFLKAGASLAETVADAEPAADAQDRDGLSSDSWIAWSKAQLQKLGPGR